MAQVTTVDVTSASGSATFPITVNDVMGMVEKIASQRITALKSTNKIIDGFKEYVVDNGMVIEEAVIEMAQGQAFDKNTPDFAPKDPTCQVRYFNNWESKQFPTTVRRNDIRKIIANKGEGVEDVVAKILDTITQGEGAWDFEKSRNLIFTAPFVDYSEILGTTSNPLVPSTMKGVLYALRDMFNHVKSNNSDLTVETYVSSVPEEDIRIAVTTKLLNLIDVVELAHVFNLSKEELFGKLVVIDVDDITDHSKDYIAYVYDVKALGKATRLVEYSQDVIGSALYTNHYLTVERAYFYNGLFKGAKIDCSKAAAAALATLLEDAE